MRHLFAGYYQGKKLPCSHWHTVGWDSSLRAGIRTKFEIWLIYLGEESALSIVSLALERVYGWMPNSVTQASSRLRSSDTRMRR